MTTKVGLARLFEQSRLIFKGRIEKSAASNVRHVVPTSNTMTVAVEEVCVATTSSSGLVGKIVTGVFDVRKAAVEPGEMRGSIAPFNYIVKGTFLRPREVMARGKPRLSPAHIATAFLAQCGRSAHEQDWQVH